VVYGLLIVLIAVYQPAGIMGWITGRLPSPSSRAAPGEEGR
jgi:hypothetical protein